MHRFIDIANVITLMALLSAAVCLFLAMNGQIAYAVVALIAAGLCDLFDGFVARKLSRTAEQQRFGGHLDSLIDACAFGFAPIALLYAAGLRQAYDVPLLGLFVACAVWRLAYFDTVGFDTVAIATVGFDTVGPEVESRTRYYVGLPTTYVALILPLVFLVALIDSTWFYILARIMVVVMAGAMVSSLRIRKPGGVTYLCFLLLALGVATVLIAFASRIHLGFSNT